MNSNQQLSLYDSNKLSFYTSEGHEASGEPPIYFADYVTKLAKPLSPEGHLNHMVLGVAGEAGELVDAIKKHTIYEKELDRVNVIEELGDLLFYMQGIMNPLKITFDEVLFHNFEKLKKRYEKLTFSNEEAIARADKVEEQLPWGLDKSQLGETK